MRRQNVLSALVVGVLLLLAWGCVANASARTETWRTEMRFRALEDENQRLQAQIFCLTPRGQKRVEEVRAEIEKHFAPSEIRYDTGKFELRTEKALAKLYLVSEHLIQVEMRKVKGRQEDERYERADPQVLSPEQYSKIQDEFLAFHSGWTGSLDSIINDIGVQMVLRGHPRPW